MNKNIFDSFLDQNRKNLAAIPMGAKSCYPDPIRGSVDIFVYNSLPTRSFDTSPYKDYYPIDFIEVTRTSRPSSLHEKRFLKRGPGQ